MATAGPARGGKQEQFAMTKTREPAVDGSSVAELTEAIETYFDRMYDCDTSRLEQTFAPTAQLHGFRDGKLMAWPMQVYRDILDKRQSPKSVNAVREDEILFIDFASTTQAMTKVRVRVNTMVFVDHLTWHRIDGTWLITSKGFHVVSQDGPPI
ncbi:nuclear transport factor 2 family protein [Bosea sp. CCNWLW174]|uniref:nuclear transport factor 2 family protein n=1 Tax=unclassified Bosea (in: a-proteobacteria) TaxID=2653178 RepID=UPI00301444F9